MVSQADISALLDAYFDNAGYEASASTSEANAFVTACVRLLGLRPEEGYFEDGRYRLSAKVVENQLNYARKWLAANSGSTTGSAGGGSVRYLDVSQWRGYG